jgi:hypothetical protein
VLIASIREAAATPDREEFIQRMTEALDPILDLYAEKGEEFEIVARRSFIENGGFTELNQLLAYDIDGTTVRLHIPPNEMTSPGEKRRLLVDGLRMLASVLVEREDLLQVNAASWIVAAHPHLMERLGFTIDGGIDEEVQRTHFAGETRPIALAHIDRGAFLRLYGSSG